MHNDAREAPTDTGKVSLAFIFVAYEKGKGIYSPKKVVRILAHLPVDFCRFRRYYKSEPRFPATVWLYRILAASKFMLKKWIGKEFGSIMFRCYNDLANNPADFFGSKVEKSQALTAGSAHRKAHRNTVFFTADQKEDDR